MELYFKIGPLHHGLLTCLYFLYNFIKLQHFVIKFFDLTFQTYSKSKNNARNVFSASNYHENMYHNRFYDKNFVGYGGHSQLGFQDATYVF